MNPWVRLLRPGNGAISFVGTVVGGLAALGVWAGHGLEALPALLLAGVTTFLATSAGNVLNDYLDREGDKKNHPDRPLPSGQVQPGPVRTYAAVLFVLSGLPLLVLWVLGWLPRGALPFALPFFVWALAVGLLLAYELRWKAEGLLGNATVAVLTGAVFLFGATVVDSPLLALPLAGMAALATLSREVIKDMEDAGGDVDRRTLPREHGMPAAALAARLSVAGAIVLSPLPLLSWLPRLPAPAAVIYLVLVALADLVFVVSVRDLPERLHEGQSRSKQAMVLALLGFLGAALR